MSAQNPEPRKRAKMFEVVPGQHRPKLLRNGALFGLFMALAVYVMYFRPPIPVLSQTGYEVEADLADATNIRPGFTPVRVSGILVGQVTDQKDLGPGQGVRITMEMEDGKGVDKVYKNATAYSRWRTLLGRNHYIDLDIGDPSTGEISGPIPKTRTGGQIELDQALDSFDKSGRDAVSNIVGQTGEAFADGEGVRSAVRAVPPAMRELAPALEALQGKEEGDLAKLVFQANRAMKALGRDEKALGGLIDDGAIALGVTAARRADIGETLRNAGASLAQTRSTAVRLRTTLDELDPLAADLRPGARVLDETAITTRDLLRKATPLLVDLRPTFRDLAPAARSARTAARSGAPALANFQPILDRFKTTLIPWFNETNEESKRRNYEMIGPALSAAAGVMAPGDYRGALARFQAGAGEGIVSPFSPCRTDLFNKYVTTEEGKIKCELLADVLSNALSGGAAPARFKSRLVPDDLIKQITSKKLTIDGAVKKLQSTVKTLSGGKP